jgi:Holliday junction resolvasome RuvABC endonuclease subunit
MCYIWAIDISLSNSGIAIFNEEYDLVETFCIPTDSRELVQERLSEIASKILHYKSFYKPCTLVLERGFTRFNTATQQIYRVHGLINYLFAECEQIYLPPKTIKMAITGKGNSDKKKVMEKVKELYPYSQCLNTDESDAIAIGYTYIKQQNGE